MRYRVLAPLVIARDSAGIASHVYKDGIIADLSDEQRPHLLDQELVEEIPDATPPGVYGPEDGDQGPDQGDHGASDQGSAEQGDGSTPVVSQPAPENPESDPSQAEPTVDPNLPKPPQIAKKEVWVDWAVKAGRMDRPTAEASTLETLKALA